MTSFSLGVDIPTGTRVTLSLAFEGLFAGLLVRCSADLQVRRDGQA